MQKIYLLLGLIIGLIGCQSKQEVRNHYFDEKAIDEKLYPYEDHFLKKNYPEKEISAAAYFKAMKHAAKDIDINRSIGNWETQGPGNISGRIGTIAIDTDDNIYLGYSKGGLFKSTDGGLSFQAIFDNQAFLALSDIEIDPNDNETIYVGTGDVNLSGFFSIGNGLAKSVDGGNSWQMIGLEEGSIVSKVHVDPSNSDLVYASTMGVPGLKSTAKGVFKSTNAGGDWEQILFVNDSTGIQDMLVDPNNADIIYATGWNRFRSNKASVVTGPDARIYRTRDGGMSWDTLSNGLPEGDFSRVGLDMSGSDSNVIFANIAHAETTESCPNNSGHQFLGIYKSIDGGDNWFKVVEAGENGLPCGTHGGFAWFFGQMRVNPNNDDDMFILGVGLYRSIDGGLTWDNVTNGMHVDHHELVFHGDRIYVGNDGGAYYSENQSNDWNDLDFIPTGMLYRVAYNPHRPDLYYGGSQDNGCYEGNAEDINSWIRFNGGDGFQVAFHATNPEIFFAESQNGNIRMFHPSGNRTISGEMEGNQNWDTPYFVSPHETNLVIAVSDKVYGIGINEENNDFVTTQLSDNLTEPESDWFRHDISAVNQSPLNQLVFYAGTSDGLAWRSLNFGTNWEMITDNYPRRYVSDIVASPNNENTVFLSLTGYRDADYTPHLFRSISYGSDWEDISGNLPQLAINDILVFPGEDDRIVFVATDGGVYFTEDAGQTWERLGENMPIVAVFDLAYNVENNQITAGTFGRSIMSFDLEQVGIGPGVAAEDLQAIEGLNIYPTLLEDRLNIELESKADYTFELYNLSAQLIERRTLRGNQLLNFSELDPGPYVVNIIQGSNRIAQRIIKI